MIETVTQQLQQLLAQEEDLSKGSEQYKNFSAALLSYKRMIAEGLIKPRGNRLQDIEERVKGNMKCNVPVSEAANTPIQRKQ